MEMLASYTQSNTTPDVSCRGSQSDGHYVVGAQPGSRAAATGYFKEGTQIVSGPIVIYNRQ